MENNQLIRQLELSTSDPERQKLQQLIIFRTKEIEVLLNEATSEDNTEAEVQAILRKFSLANQELA